MHVQPLRLAGKLALTISILGLSAAATNTQTAAGQEPVKQEAPRADDPRNLALQGWHGYLEQIGWPKDMRERIAPRFLGNLSNDVGNEYGGRTITFDGSRPGLRATVTIVLNAGGKLVFPPAVELADILEAR